MSEAILHRAEGGRGSKEQQPRSVLGCLGKAVHLALHAIPPYTHLVNCHS